MKRGWWSVLDFIKSIISSFVFAMFRIRLLAEHHSATVVSSANFASWWKTMVNSQRCIMTIGGDSAHSPEVSWC